VDDTGQPKILDFGVARLTVPDGQQATVAGEVVGTPQYLSPEQLVGDAHGVDLRCDVDAPGVILYEVLAGRPPYVRAGRQPFDVVRIVTSEEPPALGAVQRALRGDLELIAAKALE
jgi:serine/threonine protein kinase